VHPMMMGLEEHLLTMFRGDFEFHDGAAASHLGRSGGPSAVTAATTPAVEPAAVAQESPEPESAETATSNVIAIASWAPDAQKELQKIPFFVRGKARRNTEKFAAEHGLATITVDTLYDAKAQFGR